ncbi:MAG: GAF domain-containing protein, partial [Oscillospiraceae bacterium]
YVSGEVYTALEMLYETTDIYTSINMILKIIGKRYNMSRGYIFEYTKDNLFVNYTYEWCADDIEPTIYANNKIKGEEFIHFVDENTKHGIYYCNNIDDLEEEQYNLLASKNVKSFVNCAILNNGKMKGLIGFDDCVNSREWSEQDILTLEYISKIISIFLVKKNISQELTQSSLNHKTLLENISGFIFATSQDTDEILFTNNALTQQMSDEKLQLFYSFIFNQKPIDSECNMIDTLRATQSPVTTEVYDETLEMWLRVVVSYISWGQGDKAVLVCCSDITKYK